MKKRNLYLKTISVEEALEKYKKVLETVIEVKWERIPVTESLNRVTRLLQSMRNTAPPV